MTDWNRIKQYRELPSMKEGIKVTNDLVDLMLQNLLTSQAPKEVLAGIDELRPRGYDLPFAILDNVSKLPIGIAKLTLREDEESVTGHIGIYHIDGTPRSRKERRKHTKMTIEAVQLLARIAFEECGLSRVFLHVAPSQIAFMKLLGENGFVRTGSRMVPSTDHSTLFVYEKKLV